MHENALTYMDQALKTYGEKLEHNVPLATFGVDSIESATLAAKIQDDWGVRVPSDTLAFMTIEQVANMIASSSL